MFPLEFPFRALRDARPKSWVLDPFCGRGTTLYAARLRGLRSIGIDSNPVAVAIAAAKLLHVSIDKVVSLAKGILHHSRRGIDLPDGDFWRWCYHPKTLIEICILRDNLLSGHLGDAGIVLRALILGVLHGPTTKGEPSYLSNQMPRTYATKPDAAVDYWEKRSLRPKRVDTLDLIRRRAHYLLEQLPARAKGRVLLGDARKPPLRYRNRFTHVITSPPYLGMRSYVPDQWLRNWFLGADEDVLYDESHQLGSSTRETFLVNLAKVWHHVAIMCASDAILVIRFGAIPSLEEDPGLLLKQSLALSGAPWKVIRTRQVPPPPSAMRQANQFTPKLKDPLKEVDLYARLEA